jgi:hypothetical protein
MKSCIQAIGFAVVVGSSSQMSTLLVEGRQWQTIIEHSIYRRSNIDSRRYELTIEADPFYFPGNEIDSPTESPKVDSWVTLSPTFAPSSVPSDSPSLSPTAWDIEQNGGCRFGHELFEVHMYDSWGDGWDNTMLVITGIEDQDPDMVLPTSSMQRTVTDETGDSTVKITRTITLDSQNAFNPDEVLEVDPLGVIFQGGLRRGSHDSADICLLPKRCYQVTVAGGEFLNEVSWDIRPANLQSKESVEPILGGGAPAGCTFSLPDEYGHHFCANTCSTTLPPEATTTAPQVLQNLQENGATGSAAIAQATGGSLSSTFGTTRSSSGQIGGNSIRSGVYGSFVGNFKDNNSNND